jgi:hypothetical protein
MNIIERNEGWRHILQDPDFEATYPGLMDRVNKFDEKDEMILSLVIRHINVIVDEFPCTAKRMIEGFEVGCLSKILGIDTFMAYIFALAILKDYDGIGGHIRDVKLDLENGW